jgi:hypothetical protein
VRIDYPSSNELSGSFIYRKLIGQMPLHLSSPKYSQLPNANLPAQQIATKATTLGQREEMELRASGKLEKAKIEPRMFQWQL